jgi:hypothetical protein
MQTPVWRVAARLFEKVRRGSCSRQVFVGKVTLTGEKRKNKPFVINSLLNFGKNYFFMFFTLSLEGRGPG